MGSDWVLTVDGVPLQESAEPPAPSALRGPRADQELVFARHARAAACVSEAWPPEPRQRALGGLQGRVGSGVSVRAARYRSAGAHSAPGRREAPTRPRRKPLQCSPGHGGVSFKGRAQPGPPSPEPGASGEKPAGRCAEPVGLGRLRTRLGPRGHRESRATTGASGGASPPGDKRPGGGGGRLPDLHSAARSPSHLPRPGPPRPPLPRPLHYLRPSQPAPWLPPAPRPKVRAAPPFPPLADARRVALGWGLNETRARGGASCGTPAHRASERNGRGQTLVRMLQASGGRTFRVEEVGAGCMWSSRLATGQLGSQ